MTILIWPFVEADATWKTFSVQLTGRPGLPNELMEWDWTQSYPYPPLDPVTYDGPVHVGFKDSQFRLSSNFNSRKALGLSKKRQSFPKIVEKRHTLLDLGRKSSAFQPTASFLKKPPMKSSVLRKVLRCSLPVWKKHEYVESGKFRVQRRWSSTLLKMVETKVPILVRKIKLIPGRKIGDLKSNALWYEEHKRDCSDRTTYMYRNIFDVNSLDFGFSYPKEQWTGPWHSIPSSVSSALGQTLSSFGSEFTEACLAITPKILYATETQDLDDKVVAKLYSKLLDQKVDLATALAEGAKSVNMIADLLMRLLQFFLGLYRLNPSRIVKGFTGLVKDLLPLSTKKLSNDFLAYRYGITPLISDISGSVEQIAEYFDSEPKVFARSRKRTVIDNSDPFSWIPAPLGFEKQVIKDKVTIDIVYKVTYTIENLGQRRLAELGFTNPVNVNWELVPFSFVVDWFIPIGNYLRDMSSVSGLRVKECTRTTTFRVEKERYYRHIQAAGAEYPGDWIPQGEGSGEWHWMTEDFYCYREIIPVPQLPLPTFKNPFSVGHVLNGIALLVQTFSKR